LAETALRAAGAPDPERRAELGVAGINGILFDRVRGLGDDPEQRMLELLGELFALLLRP
ncbi:MAG: Tetracyclin repressor-like, C-terminal domain, partial [Solirubrobacterales bacterium]|nr:Tetracyclin repressor-like, C-terminal domain [Solirubrobacterales bacterium]